MLASGTARGMVSGIGEALGSRFSTGCGGVPQRQVGDGRKALLPACGRCRDSPQSQGRRFRPNFRYGTARPVLDKLTREDVPDPSRVLPLDLNGYLAIRKTAQERRPGREVGLSALPAFATVAQWTSP